MASDDPNSNLATPRFRRRRSTDRLGRSSTLALRCASGMNLRDRVDRQVERDALVHRLGKIDAELVQLSDERRAIVRELAALRDVLYPPVPLYIPLF